MMGRSKIAIIAAALILGAGHAVSAPASPDVTLYLPRFVSSDGVGRNVTATLNLSVWRTLRKKPWPNPDQKDFGSGLVIWSDDPLPTPAARAASATLRDNPKLDMILWGSADRYGPDVIVQSYLLARPLEDPRAPKGALWTVDRNGRSVSLGAPREFYVLGSVPLRPDVVSRFNSSSALPLCPTRVMNCSGPEVGPEVRALEHEGPWTLATTPDGRRGWVYLYEIGAQPNEIAAFAGALISYYRGDYEQAASLFGQVRLTASANPLVREDAAMLRAACLSRLGRSAAAAEIDAVRKADPYSTYALQVAIMDALQQRATPSARLRALAAELKAKAALFSPEDNWVRAAGGALDAAGA